MLLGLALIFLCGLVLAGLFERLRLPALLGMLLTGIVLGPYALDLLGGEVLAISPQLRKIALIIILMRAGLALDVGELKRAGRAALLLCFVPACFEIVGVLLFAPPLLGVSLAEAAVMGTVLAAVSPAVVVPRMLALIHTRRGTKKAIPQMIMAGAAVDDIFVMVLFTAATGLVKGESVRASALIQIPVSIVLGLLAGIAAGWLLAVLFGRAHLRDSAKVLILLSASFLLVSLEDAVGSAVGFSGLLAVMSMGATLKMRCAPLAKRLADKFSKLWVGAELLLFVLVGAAVDIRYAAAAGLWVLPVILGALCMRALGVYCSTAKTALTPKERLFCVFAYMPKATVQAAIGGVPLAMGLACGDIVLTAAVLSIFITAPLGAIAIDKTQDRLLTQDETPCL